MLELVIKYKLERSIIFNNVRIYHNNGTNLNIII
jgi:hypothetical protein